MSGFLRQKLLQWGEPSHGEPLQGIMGNVRLEPPQSPHCGAPSGLREGHHLPEPRMVDHQQLTVHLQAKLLNTNLARQPQGLLKPQGQASRPWGPYLSLLDVRHGVKIIGSFTFCLNLGFLQGLQSLCFGKFFLLQGQFLMPVLLYLDNLF